MPDHLASRAPSKVVATWLSLALGAFGAHRFYLFGAGDRLGWLMPLPTLVGGYGFWRLREISTDDRLGSVLVPLLGLTVSVGMMSAIVYGLASESRWHVRFGNRADGRSGWLTVLGAVVALAIGAAVTLATIAFVAQRYFEWSSA